MYRSPRGQPAPGTQAHCVGPGPPPAPGSQAPHPQGRAPPAGPPRVPGRNSLSLLGTRCASLVASCHVGCQNPTPPRPPASGSRPQGSVLIRPLDVADTRHPVRPASSGRRREKAEPRDTTRVTELGETGAGQKQWTNELVDTDNTGGRGDTVKGSSTRRRRRLQRTQTSCREAVRLKCIHDVINQCHPSAVNLEKPRPHSPDPLAQVVSPPGPGLLSPLPRGHPSKPVCGVSRCPGPAHSLAG